jgi:hypothetical protein
MGDPNHYYAVKGDLIEQMAPCQYYDMIGNSISEVNVAAHLPHLPIGSILNADASAFEPDHKAKSVDVEKVTRQLRPHAPAKNLDSQTLESQLKRSAETLTPAANPLDRRLSKSGKGLNALASEFIPAEIKTGTSEVDKAAKQVDPYGIQHSKDKLSPEFTR